MRQRRQDSFARGHHCAEYTCVSPLSRRFTTMLLPPTFTLAILELRRPEVRHHLDPVAEDRALDRPVGRQPLEAGQRQQRRLPVQRGEERVMPLDLRPALLKFRHVEVVERRHLVEQLQQLHRPGLVPRLQAGK